jgi:carbon storage regulator
MLVLSRKVRETIVIGGNIRLTVIAIRGKETRVAIEAPQEILILRDELPRNPPPVPDPTALGRRSRLSPSSPLGKSSQTIPRPVPEYSVPECGWSPTS